MSPWRSRWAGFWGGRLNFTGVQVRSAPGIACPRAAVTWWSASLMSPGPPRKVAWSVPYAGAQFGLVVPRESRGIRFPGRPSRQAGRDRGRHGGALGEGPHGRSLQVARSSFWTGSRPRRWTPRFWMPTSPPGTCTSILELGLRLVPEYVPRERWNMALAVRAKDAQLLVEINRALAQLAESGELRRIYDDVRRAVSSPVYGVDRAEGIARYLAAHSRAGRAGRQHGPRQPALFQRQG